MTNITLTPNELAEVLALPAGKTMTLRRVLDAPADALKWRRAGRGWFVWRNKPNLVERVESPLGKPGDVLTIGTLTMGGLCDYRGYDEIRLTILSVEPRLVEGTWLAEAEVKKE